MKQTNLFQLFIDEFGLEVATDVIPALGERPTDWHVHPWEKSTTPFLIDESMPLELRRSVELDEIRHAAQPIGIQRFMPIQVSDPGAGGLSTVSACEQEELRLRVLAAAHPDVVACCVGIATEGDIGELRERLAMLAADPFVVSVRNIYTQEAAPGENPFAAPRFVAGVSAIVEAGLAVEILCKERLGQFPFVVELLTRFPNGRFIINHCGKPLGVAEACPSDNYRQFLDQLAALEAEVAVKTGGLDEEPALAGSTDLPLRCFAPFFQEVLQRMGTGAIIMESNYPVSVLGGSYELQEQALADSFARQWYWVWEQGVTESLPEFMYQNAERILRIK